MRALLLSIASLATADAQSHPGWWTFVAPDSKALVGIHWQSLQDTLLGEQLRLQFREPGPPFNPVIPDLPCLLQSRDLLISAPELVMGASGGCTAADLRSQATERGWKHSAYKGFDLWAALDSGVLQWNEKVVLIGAVADLRAAIDRSLEENREYSPLLMSGAKMGRESDFWVASTEAKGETSSAYSAFAIAPGDDDSTSLTTAETIGTSIALQVESAKRATEIATAIRRANPSAQVSASGTTVTATTRLAKRRPALVTSLPAVTDRNAAAAPSGPPEPEPAKPEIASASVPAAVATPAKTEAKPEPQVIRIYGLDEGTREIVLPSKRPLQ